MAKAKCFRCGASATAETFEQARKQLNHSVGLSRGIKCGDTYGRVQEIKEPQKTKQEKPSPTETKIAEPKPETTEAPITPEKQVKEKKTKKSKKE